MMPVSTEVETPIQDFEAISEKDLPSHTYKMRLEKLRVLGYANQIEAMKQAIFKIVNTERHLYNKVYGDNYGIELQDLYGMPMTFVIPEVQRRITEALTWDERITEVKDFTFEKNKKALLVGFTAVTIFGNVESSVEVVV